MTFFRCSQVQEDLPSMSFSCKAKLKYDSLWQAFHNLETEMIITKTGRRMFPPLQMHLSEIDPQAVYCVFLEMVPAARCRYKYSTAGGWTPAGSEEVQSPHRIYLHPESPAKGEYWMSQPVNFGRVKLTNTPAPPAGQVVLSSMHKYQPRVIIVQTSDPRTLHWSPSTFVVFPETQFVAVTAYQNEKITQLKIDNNPFAKGFRQNGQAKCKRKRLNVQEQDHEEEDELIVVDEEQESGSENANNNGNVMAASPRSLSARDSPKDEDKKSETSVTSPGYPRELPVVKYRKIEEAEDVSRRLSSPAPHHFYPHMNTSAYLPLRYMSTPYQYPIYHGLYQSFMTPSWAYPPAQVEQGEKKRYTDFSIKALIGC